MSDIVFVTNRKLSREDFSLRLKKLAKARPAAIILREKDLSEADYAELAKFALETCKKHNTGCILHGFPRVARELSATALHLPLPALRNLTTEERCGFQTLGASCHSVQDALEAERLACTYITAGHIFETDCKKGVPARGLAFLQEVCRSVSLPVYAIGGITEENIGEVFKAGAKGACVMSGPMVCSDPNEYLTKLKERCHEI